MTRSFPEFYDYYISVAKEKSFLSGKQMQDPFGDKRGKFDYESILAKLEKIKSSLDTKQARCSSDLSGESSGDN
ncbi:ubiquitin-conjugating enzyme E2 Z-like [Paramuricea clavata]|nr:ubiquitin-conjugating enzyme E2 Z-like [Paramuricea clavata]